MNTIITILLLLGNNSHDIQVAYYKINHVDDNLKVKFVFEYNDIIETQNELKNTLNDQSLQDYINANFSIAINNITQTISFEKMKIKHKHIYLIGQVANVTETILLLDIKNICLLNIANHSNIIEVNINTEQRDFLMNSKRTSISVKY